MARLLHMMLLCSNFLVIHEMGTNGYMGVCAAILAEAVYMG
eukprot:CAMPEP_0184328248 /NCGR_PEP_ID=MMETSP1049-20130417/143522_1 /TAXON_ID=77928 /ORGANISM="Proteomonas sulcata, Strain CCMP704" /LENGTH=40 /DNA_ID= /DNA_START= /DNA_END= /DNA_ORIENTATION=